MADEASKNPSPQPTKEDHEDVSWALSTAEATWNRGDRADALKWLRRAAESASEAEQDDRALQLAKAAAELASQLEATPSVPPKPASMMPPPITRPPMSAPPARSMPPPLPGGAARATKPPALPPAKGQYLAPSPLAETMVSQQPITPVRKSMPPAASKVDAPKAPTHSSAPRPVAAAKPAPVVGKEAVRSTARYSEAPKEEGSKPAAAKSIAPKASDSSKNAVSQTPPAPQASTSKPSPPIPPTPTTSPDVARASRLSQMARSSGEDTATWTGAEDRPSEPETPQSKRGANGNAERASTERVSTDRVASDRGPRTPAAPVEDKHARGKYGPPTTRFNTNASTEEIDGWPTAALTGDPSDFHDEHKTRIDAPAYRDSDDLYDGSAIVPPKTGDVRPTQAVRVVVWRAADGVHVAPHGTTVSAISVDAMLVALDPTADLFAWLKGK
jgi:hypothetical protein